MNRYIWLILLLCVASLCSAQQPESEGLTAAKCFTVAPTTVFNMLDGNVRLDMLDYYHAGVDRQSANSMGGPCKILSETPYSLRFIGGNDVEYQLFVLNPTAPKPIIGLIETILTPIPDSILRLYNARWQIIKGFITEPTLKDWLKPEGAKQREEVERQLPFIMATYSYDDSTNTLTVTNSMDQYFSANDTPSALSLVKDSLTYKWDGKKFKFVK